MRKGAGELRPSRVAISPENVLRSFRFRRRLPGTRIPGDLRTRGYTGLTHRRHFRSVPVFCRKQPRIRTGHHDGHFPGRSEKPVEHRIAQRLRSGRLPSGRHGPFDGREHRLRTVRKITRPIRAPQPPSRPRREQNDRGDRRRPAQPAPKAIRRHGRCCGVGQRHPSPQRFPRGYVPQRKILQFPFQNIVQRIPFHNLIASPVFRASGKGDFSPANTATATFPR